MFEEKYKAPTEISIEYRKKQEFKKLGDERIKRGHSFFEFNFDTGSLVMVDLGKPRKTTDVTANSIQNVVIDSLKAETTHRYFVKKDPNCLYFSALNFKSAMKRLAKLMPDITFDLIPEEKPTK